MRRELAAASGLWFNGGQAKPLMSRDTFQRKLSDIALYSDWVGTFPEFPTPCPTLPSSCFSGTFRGVRT